MNDKELANHLQRLAQPPADADAALQHYLANKSLMISDSWYIKHKLQHTHDISEDERLRRIALYQIERIVTKVVEDKHTKLLLVYEVEEKFVRTKNQNNNDGIAIYL